MNTKILFTTLVLALWMLAIGGCSKDKSTPEPKTTIVGTWKCIGFGTVGNDKIKEIEPKNCAECYKITFKEDGTLEGRSSANGMAGTYKVKLGKFVLLQWISTHLGEQTEDGDLYVESMSKVTNFNFSNEGELLLYYNNKKEYLIFKPKQ